MCRFLDSGIVLARASDNWVILTGWHDQFMVNAFGNKLVDCKNRKICLLQPEIFWGTSDDAQ